GPKDTTKVFAADEFAGVLKQKNQNAERLLAHFQRHAVAAQLESLRIDFEEAEAPNPGAIFEAIQRAAFRPRCFRRSLACLTPSALRNQKAQRSLATWLIGTDAGSASQLKGDTPWN